MATSKTLTAELHLRIPQKLYRDLASAAVADNRTLSNMIRVLLQEALEKRKKEKIDHVATVQTTAK